MGVGVPVVCGACAGRPELRGAEPLGCRSCGHSVSVEALRRLWVDEAASLDLLDTALADLVRDAAPETASVDGMVWDPDVVAALCREVVWDDGLSVVWRYPFSLLAGDGVEPARDQLRDWLAGLDGELVDGILQLLVAARKDRRMRRRPLGPCNVLTVPEALAELGMGDKDGMAWLREKGLIVHPGRGRRGSGRVVAADLVEAIRAAGPTTRKPAPTALPLKRTKRF